MIYASTSRQAEADLLYRRALSICEERLGKNHPKVIAILQNWALLLVDMEKFAEAELHLKRALKMLDESEHPPIRERGGVLGNYARLLRLSGRETEEEPYLRAALICILKLLGVNGNLHPKLARGLRRYYEILRKRINDDKEIAKEFEKIGCEAGLGTSSIQKMLRSAETEPAEK